MTNWPNSALCAAIGIEIPVLLAPMAGAGGPTLAAAVATAGGLGALPCGMLSAPAVAADIEAFGQQSNAPLNLNFFCHEPQEVTPADAKAWRAHLATYYDELSIDRDAAAAAANRAPFDDAMCTLVEQHRPRVVSFHFGLPEPALLERVRATGALVLSSATTVREARWLADHGADAIIAQGNEAGGHRAMFLTTDPAAQPGTFALLPQVVDAVSLPVIAAGGIADGRGMAAALALGASAVQVGTAYLKTTQATTNALHRAALDSARDDNTTLTNLFSGAPARGITNRLMREVGPMSAAATAYPTAGGALAPLKQAAEADGRTDFSSLWSGQSAALATASDAHELTLTLAAGARTAIERLYAAMQP